MASCCSRRSPPHTRPRRDSSSRCPRSRPGSCRTCTSRADSRTAPADPSSSAAAPPCTRSRPSCTPATRRRCASPARTRTCSRAHYSSARTPRGRTGHRPARPDSRPCAVYSRRPSSRSRTSTCNRRACSRTSLRSGSPDQCPHTRRTRCDPARTRRPRSWADTCTRTCPTRCDTSRRSGTVCSHSGRPRIGRSFRSAVVPAAARGASGCAYELVSTSPSNLCKGSDQTYTYQTKR